MTTKPKKRLGDVVTVRSEPRTYERHKPVSMFVDLVNSTSTVDPDRRDEAQRRLARHRQECEREQRANPTTGLGSGGEFAVPAWLIGEFATSARAGRVLGDLVPNYQLPSNVSSVHVPNVTSGADAGIQAAQGNAVTDADEVTADATSPVVTIAGNADVSQQLLDFTPAPGYDQIALTDLTRAYNQTLEKQLLAGTGSAGQLRGITNVTGISTVSYTSGSPTLPGLWAALGQASAAVGNTRLRPLDVWLLAPRRWSWIASSVDDQHRPITSPGNSGPHTTDFPMAGGTLPTGPILGAPAYPDGAIPAGATADVIYGLHLASSDFALWESEPHLLVNTSPLSGTFQVRVSFHRYCAFVVYRPSSVVVLSGTGLAQPSGY